MDNYRQATWVGLGGNTGDPPADKGPLKADNPKNNCKAASLSSVIMEIADIGCHIAYLSVTQPCKITAEFKTS